MALIIGIGLALFLFALWDNQRIARQSLAIRLALGILRGLALLLIFGALLRPMTVLSIPEDRETSLLVLVDQSQSMSLPIQHQGPTRLQWVKDRFLAEGTVLDRLTERFRPRLYAFDKKPHRLWAADSLVANGTRTDLATALETGRRDLTGMPLSGALLITDGADNNGNNPLRQAYALQQEGIPIHALGIGNAADLRDLKVVRVETPDQVEAGSLVDVQIEIASQGYGACDVEVQIKSDTLIIAQQTVAFAGDSRQRIDLSFAAERPGIQRYTAEIPVAQDELLKTNNRRLFIIEVLPRQALSVLFLEGRPRTEFAYIKRAIERDEELQVDADIAVNDQSEYRIRGAQSEDSNLFAYDAVILGDVELTRLLEDGEKVLERYVGSRGGSLLVLGSASLLNAQGALLDLLPAQLTTDAHMVGQTLRFAPTRAGRSHPMLTKLDNAFWDKLPALSGYLHGLRPKPGATTLLANSTDNTPLLTVQRYGAGKIALFAPLASWRWRAQSPTQDRSYERFWGQLIRWLASRKEQRVALEMERFSFEPEDQVRLRARVIDKDYKPMAYARVTAQISPTTAPSHQTLENPADTPRFVGFYPRPVAHLSLEPVLGQEGYYEAVWQATEEGEFAVEVRASQVNDPPDVFFGKADGYFEVRASHIEFEGRLTDHALLQRLCQISGGLFFTQDEIDTIPDRLPERSPGVTRQEEIDLWDRPEIFGALLLLLAGEWIIRKRRGMV